MNPANPPFKGKMRVAYADQVGVRERGQSEFCRFPIGTDP